MADVRTLLRQQRQSRRIDHPHAAYSDAGKLLCTLCREQIRAETQWESHIRSTGHQRRAAVAATTTPNAGPPAPSEDAEPVTEKAHVSQIHEAATVQGPPGEQEDGMDENQKSKAASYGIESRTQAHKRKLSDDNYDDDADARDLDEAVRRKRSRGDISIDVSAANHRRGSGTDKDKDSADAAAANPPARRDAANRTPPTLARRMSSTPSRGVELQIPSRPATPAAHRDSSSSSTTPGLSTLAGLSAASAAMAAHVSATPSAAAAATTTTTTNGSIIATEKLPGAHVDEDEWAAFEAEMAATAAPYADDAVISAPAMNAEEAAAAAEAATAGTNGEGGGGSRKSRADLDIEGEREDAARAREDELNDMQDLDARVRRLKEKREELRQRASSIGQENGPARLQSQVPDEDGKNPALGNGAKENAEDGEDEDDDEDDEEDDWDGFRFRR